MSPAPPYLERRIVGLVALLLIFGQVMLYSASGVLGLERHGSEFYYLSRQLSAALLGFGLLLLFSRVKYQFLGKIAPFLLAIQLVLAGMTLVPAFSHGVQGVTRWITIGPIHFQPAELAKISVAIYVAQLLTFRDAVTFTIKKRILFSLPVLLLLFFIFRQPDLGSTILLAAMIIAVFFVAGIRPVYVLGFISIGIVFFVLALVHSDYRRRRVMAFLNPWEDPQGTGFQSIQSFLSFYSGKIFGVGLGNGNSKLFYLPEVHTDFIYALVGEEMGFLGTITLLLLFAYLGYLLFKIVSHAPDPFGRYLSFSLAFILMAQVAVNLGGVTGIIPVKGLPLPFLSWGRSALLVNLATVGILLNVSRQSANLPATPPKKERARNKKPATAAASPRPVPVNPYLRPTRTIG